MQLIVTSADLSSAVILLAWGPDNRACHGQALALGQDSRPAVPLFTCWGLSPAAGRAWLIFYRTRLGC
jgi:hypothetical protein